MMNYGTIHHCLHFRTHHWSFAEFGRITKSVGLNELGGMHNMLTWGGWKRFINEKNWGLATGITAELS